MRLWQGDSVCFRVQNICCNRMHQLGRNQFSPFLATLAMLAGGFYVFQYMLLFKLYSKPLEHIFHNAKNLLIFLQSYLESYQFTVLYSYHLFFRKKYWKVLSRSLTEFLRLNFSNFSKVNLKTNFSNFISQSNVISAFMSSIIHISQANIF